MITKALIALAVLALAALAVVFYSVCIIVYVLRGGEA